MRQNCSAFQVRNKWPVKKVEKEITFLFCLYDIIRKKQKSRMCDVVWRNVTCWVIDELMDWWKTFKLIDIFLSKVNKKDEFKKKLKRCNKNWFLSNFPFCFLEYDFSQIQFCLKQN